MRVLVIGGTNFMGPYVVRRLVERGHEVAVFHRGRTEAELPEGVEELRGNRRRLEEHAEELRRTRPDVVLDMVPMNESDARGWGLAGSRCRQVRSPSSTTRTSEKKSGSTSSPGAASRR